MHNTEAEVTVRFHRLVPRRPVAVAGAVVLALTAAACSSSSSSSSSAASGKPVTITYWSSSTQAEINWLDSHFNATHQNIKVQGQYIASADETTAKEVAAIKSGTEPNVVIGQDPSALPLLAESGKVVDLSKSVTSQTNALYPGIKSALFYKGQQLGLALGGVGDYVLFYNKKDFAKAGISPRPQPGPSWKRTRSSCPTRPSTTTASTSRSAPTSGSPMTGRACCGPTAGSS